jgi:hypothetical protein
LLEAESVEHGTQGWFEEISAMRGRV